MPRNDNPWSGAFCRLFFLIKVASLKSVSEGVAGGSLPLPQLVASSTYIAKQANLAAWFLAANSTVPTVDDVRLIRPKARAA